MKTKPVPACPEGQQRPGTSVRPKAGSVIGRGAAERLDRPGARDARRALEPPDCGGTGAHCDDDVECASRGLLLENPAALGEHDGETDEKHRRNDGGHELRKPVEDRREDFVPVPGPAVAEEELRDGEVEACGGTMARMMRSDAGMRRPVRTGVGMRAEQRWSWTDMRMPSACFA